MGLWFVAGFRPVEVKCKHTTHQPGGGGKCGAQDAVCWESGARVHRLTNLINSTTSYEASRHGSMHQFFLDESPEILSAQHKDLKT